MKNNYHRAKLFLADESATKSLGQIVGQNAQGTTIIALTGQLGTGKTVLVKGLAAGLGVKLNVNSPTFVLMNEYIDGRLPLYHVDLYRLQDNASQAKTNPSPIKKTFDQLQFFETELEELIMRPCVMAIEWAEILDKYHLPLKTLAKDGYIALTLSYVKENERARVAEIEAFEKDELMKEVLKKFDDLIIKC